MHSCTFCTELYISSDYPCVFSSLTKLFLIRTNTQCLLIKDNGDTHCHHNTKE